MKHYLVMGALYFAIAMTHPLGWLALLILGWALTGLFPAGPNGWVD